MYGLGGKGTKKGQCSVLIYEVVRMFLFHVNGHKYCGNKVYIKIAVSHKYASTEKD